MPFFNLTYARNYGAAFSFLADQSGWQTYFFLGLALFISGFLTYLLYQNKAKSQWENVGYALIIGGGLANGIDRAFRGYVVDYLHLFWKTWHYPIFNLADVFIFVGVCSLFVNSYQEEKAITTPYVNKNSSY